MIEQNIQVSENDKVYIKLEAGDTVDISQIKKVM